jgi:ADP-sugar diphosphatase
MLMILRPKDASEERWVIVTVQPRIPAGSLSFLEIPAGMIDERTKDFKGAAANEIEEETGLKINRDHLLDMTELALRGSPNPENLKAAMYPSPGGSDEFIALFLWEQEMERLEFESLREKLTGDKKAGGDDHTEVDPLWGFVEGGYEGREDDGCLGTLREFEEGGYSG